MRTAVLVAGFVLAAAAAVLALLVGGDRGALVGVGLAGLAGVLILLHALLAERERHEAAERELAAQAQFREALVDSFRAIASTQSEEELVELARSEAERLFGARATILGPGQERAHSGGQSELLVRLRSRDDDHGALQLVRDQPFDRDDEIRATLLGDFVSRAIENARLLEEARVREAERHRLSSQLISAEQEERRRLALFLHDTSVQSLSGIALMLDAGLGAIADGRPDEARTVIEKALARHRATIRALRDLSFNLEPLVLRDRGFGPAVSALAEQVGLEHEVKIEAEVSAGEELPENTQAALYQIIREALHGAIRRGPPTRISIRVERADGGGGVEASVEDDAPGERRRGTFDPIAERARTLSGSLEVEHGQNGGTTVRILLPAQVARE